MPEGRGTFVDLTVEENLRVGAWACRDRGSIPKDMERVFGYFPILAERRRQIAGTLSGGEQQMLAVARALMLGPRLLLLDEPSLGLAPLIVQDIFRILKAVNAEAGVSILLVEQNARESLALCQRAYVLAMGRVRAEGVGATLHDDPEIRRLYLGG